MCYTVLNVFKITNDKCVFYTFFYISSYKYTKY